MSAERVSKEGESRGLVRQVLVAVGASPLSGEALEAAVDLAESLGAELKALFVQEPAMLRFAEHPVTSELYLPSGIVRSWNPDLLQIELRAHISRTRRSLERLVRLRRLTRWSFEVAEGDVKTVLLEATETGVLTTILGRERWSFPAEATARRAWSEVLFKSKGLTLVHRLGRLGRLPAVIVFDGSESARRALDLVARLRAGRREEVRVLLPPLGAEEIRRLRSDVESWGRHSGLLPRTQRLTSTDPEDVAKALAEFQRHLVVLPAEAPALETNVVRAVLESAAAVLVVRA